MKPVIRGDAESEQYLRKWVDQVSREKTTRKSGKKPSGMQRKADLTSAQKTSLKSAVSKLAKAERQILKTFLSTTYGNNMVIQGLAAISKDGLSRLGQSVLLPLEKVRVSIGHQVIVTSEILETAQINSELLSIISDGLDSETERQ